MKPNVDKVQLPELGQVLLYFCGNQSCIECGIIYAKKYCIFKNLINEIMTKSRIIISEN